MLIILDIVGEDAVKQAEIVGLGHKTCEIEE